MSVEYRLLDYDPDKAYTLTLNGMEVAILSALGSLGISCMQSDLEAMAEICSMLDAVPTGPFHWDSIVSKIESAIGVPKNTMVS
jgi:hypothetical protein